MSQHRLLFFCHDARGLGHLRRISRIASALQGRFVCLIATGMSEAHWMVPAHCEFIRIPNWDSLSAVRAQRRGRPLWMTATREAERFKKDLLLSVEHAFRPDAILVDYLPFGLRDELRPMLDQTQARKYLIHRGLADTSDRDVLCGEATAAVGATYDAIVVTADRRIVDVASEYRFVDTAAEKIRYVGYINPVDAPLRASVTKGRPTDDRPKVVCACGGGHGGEQLLTACIEAARNCPQFDFHIALGPHGSIAPGTDDPVPTNCHVYGVCPELEELHRAACVVVNHGGYNSTMEAISGGARIIVHHIQGGDDDERILMEKRLAPHYPISSLANVEDLTSRIEEEVHLASFGQRPKFALEFNGITRIGELLRCDLGEHSGRGPSETDGDHITSEVAPIEPAVT